MPEKRMRSQGVESDAVFSQASRDQADVGRTDG
jgi:hypothetical protein